MLGETSKVDPALTEKRGEELTTLILNDDPFGRYVTVHYHDGAVIDRLITALKKALNFPDQHTRDDALQALTLMGK